MLETSRRDSGPVLNDCWDLEGIVYAGFFWLKWNCGNYQWVESLLSLGFTVEKGLLLVRWMIVKKTIGDSECRTSIQMNRSLLLFILGCVRECLVFDVEMIKTTLLFSKLLQNMFFSHSKSILTLNWFWFWMIKNMFPMTREGWLMFWANTNILLFLKKWALVFNLRWTSGSLRFILAAFYVWLKHTFCLVKRLQTWEGQKITNIRSDFKKLKFR